MSRPRNCEGLFSEVNFMALGTVALNGSIPVVPEGGTAADVLTAVCSSWACLLTSDVESSKLHQTVSRGSSTEFLARTACGYAGSAVIDKVQYNTSRKAQNLATTTRKQTRLQQAQSPIICVLLLILLAFGFHIRVSKRRLKRRIGDFTSGYCSRRHAGPLPRSGGVSPKLAASEQRIRPANTSRQTNVGLVLHGMTLELQHLGQHPQSSLNLSSGPWTIQGFGACPI